jgi:predicted DCC family thiol-disulfide oxidoreductase YuxK
MTHSDQRATIVFDGVCSLCSAWVGFVLKRDRAGEFQFAAMQGNTGRELLQQHGIDPNDPVTFLLIESGEPHTDSDAALRIVRRFGLGWRVFAITVGLVPQSLRNILYRWVARNRYRLFGRTATCLVPSPTEAHRFLH